MKSSLPICLFILCFSPALRAADLTLLNQLPAKITAAKAEAQKGWDTGITARMKEASYQYNNTLLSLINDLAKAYYPEDAITPGDTTEFLKALYSTRRFHETIANPSGESQGTLATLNVPDAVSRDLESTISDMVQTIATQESAFNYKAWKKKWLQALKS